MMIKLYIWYMYFIEIELLREYLLRFYLFGDRRLLEREDFL